MSIRKFVQQIRPVNDILIPPKDKVEQVQSYLHGSLSPDYQSKGDWRIKMLCSQYTRRRYQTICNDGEIKYKSVDVGSGKLIKRYGKGNFHFQVNVNGEDTNFYIITPKKGFVTAHYGQKTRKSATASSNVNEFLTVYFLLHKDYTDAKTFMSDIGGKTETGVLDGGGNESHMKTSLN